MNSSYQPFWPVVAATGLVKAGACNVPAHWIAADIQHTVDVDRGDGITERRYQCPTCGRLYILEAVTTGSI